MMKNYKKNIPSLALGTFVLILSAFLNPINHYAVAAMLIFCAVAVYFYIVLIQTDKNWFDVRAVFSAIWLMTLGLASLRLSGYQVEWEQKTWIYQAIAYSMFHLGVNFGCYLQETLQGLVKKYSWFQNKKKFHFHQSRLFWICFFVTMIGLFSFIMNISIKGFIPFFGKSGGNDYLHFYTRWNVFAVAGTMISGLSYFVLKTQKLSVLKRIFLLFSIVYSTFAFPILAVNRGALLASALSLTTTVFYLNKKRLSVLILCAIITVGAFLQCTNARGYSEEQLIAFFEPVQIGNHNEMTSSTTESQVTELDNFQLSGTASFIYSYLTVSHDNFNEAVSNDVDYTFGIRQLIPFNVILRIDSLSDTIDNSPIYLVREHLNTINIIGYAYYDFGIIGVAVLMFIWAVVFGFIQAVYLETKNVFALLALGNSMTPVTLCFFASWMSEFSLWMHWGLILLMFIAAYFVVPLEKESKKQDK